jgi:hypothetical protein
VIGAIDLDHVGAEGSSGLRVPVLVGGAADQEARARRTAQSGRPALGSMMMTSAGSPVALSPTITTASARNLIGTTSLRSVGPSETAISAGRSTSAMARSNSTARPGCCRISPVDAPAVLVSEPRGDALRGNPATGTPTLTAIVKRREVIVLDNAGWGDVGSMEGPPTAGRRPAGHISLIVTDVAA